MPADPNIDAARNALDAIDAKDAAEAALIADADRIMQADVTPGWQAIPIEFDGKRSSIFVNGV